LQEAPVNADAAQLIIDKSFGLNDSWTALFRQPSLSIEQYNR